MFAILAHGLRLVQTDVERPLRPRAVVVIALDGHEPRVLAQPPALLLHIRLKIRRRVMPEVAEGRMQQAGAVLVHPAEIDLIGPLAPAVLRKLLLRQPSLFHQIIRVDEIGVPGKGGKRLIRRVAVARRADREDLPIALVCFFQKINERIRFPAQIADAIGRREGGNMHQDAAASFHFAFTLSAGFARFAYTKA